MTGFMSVWPWTWSGPRKGQGHGKFQKILFVAESMYKYLQRHIEAMQADDVRALFLFMGDLNGHHQEWFCSITTSHHGVAALHFANCIRL